MTCLIEEVLRLPQAASGVQVTWRIFSMFYEIVHTCKRGMVQQRDDNCSMLFCSTSSCPVAYIGLRENIQGDMECLFLAGGMVAMVQEKPNCYGRWGLGY